MCTEKEVTAIKWHARWQEKRKSAWLAKMYWVSRHRSRAEGWLMHRWATEAHSFPLTADPQAKVTHSVAKETLELLRSQPIG